MTLSFPDRLTSSTHAASLEDTRDFVRSFNNLTEPSRSIQEISNLGKDFLQGVPEIAWQLNQMIDEICFNKYHQQKNYSSSGGMEKFIKIFNELYDDYLNYENFNKHTDFSSIFDTHIFPVLENLKNHIIAKEILKCNQELNRNEECHKRPWNTAEKLEHLEKGGDTIWLSIFKNLLNINDPSNDRSLNGRQPSYKDIDVCKSLDILNKRRIARMKDPVIAAPTR